MGISTRPSLLLNFHCRSMKKGSVTPIGRTGSRVVLLEPIARAARSLCIINDPAHSPIIMAGGAGRSRCTEKGRRGRCVSGESQGVLRGLLQLGGGADGGNQGVLAMERGLRGGRPRCCHPTHGDILGGGCEVGLCLASGPSPSSSFSSSSSPHPRASTLTLDLAPRPRPCRPHVALALARRPRPSPSAYACLLVGLGVKRGLPLRQEVGSSESCL